MSLLLADGPVQRQPASSSRLMARAALGLSIFAFIPPLGLAALVLGHMAEHRIAFRERTETETDDNEPLARAALWIAYLQLGLLSVVFVFGWGALHETVEEFRLDPLVQRVFRENDNMRPLDPQSAREAEATAQDIVFQLVAINEQIRRHSEDGGYGCTVYQLTQTGLEGISEAEHRAFFDRMQQSPYLYGITACNPSANGVTTAAYVLSAVPIPPRMPDNAALFCTDQGGSVLMIRNGTSLDCLKSGQPVR
jgi:hypothetical protein